MRPRMIRSSCVIQPVTFAFVDLSPASKIGHMDVNDVVTLTIEHDASRGTRDRLVAIGHDESEVALRIYLDRGR